MLKPKFDELTRALPSDRGVRYARRNPGQKFSMGEGPNRLFLLAGTHGQEIAGPLAAVKLIREDWRWNNVQATIVLQDPAGYQEEGYGFVGVDGHESMWPPLAGYRMNDERFWFYVDENSAWGNNVIVPERHLAMRELMDELKPTFTLSLHETVRSEVRRDLFWCGSGLLFIETYPISIMELGGVTDVIGSPLTDPINWAIRTLRDWFRPIFKKRRWHIAHKALLKNPHYLLITETMKRYYEDGGSICGDAWMRYLEDIVGYITVGPGRILHGPASIQSEWRTVTDYALGRYGCPGMTTESFQSAELGLRGLDDRVEMQHKYVTAVLDVLNENP